MQWTPARRSPVIATRAPGEHSVVIVRVERAGLTIPEGNPHRHVLKTVR
jgi:hypothetical protein